jgi:hypothetical protein
MIHVPRYGPSGGELKLNAVPAVCVAPSGFVTLAHVPLVWSKRVAAS